MAEVTTNHETIRKWVEKKGGKPAAVARTHQGDDVGIVPEPTPARKRGRWPANGAVAG
jgi:hypothetical protein